MSVIGLANEPRTRSEARPGLGRASLMLRKEAALGRTGRYVGGVDAGKPGAASACSGRRYAL